MAKKPAPSRSVPADPPPKRRGRPPRPGGPTPPAEIQRRYRERLAAAGKAYRVSDLTQPDQALFVEYRDRLHDALGKLELRQQDVGRLTARNAFLENEVIRLEREATNLAKDKIVLKREIAELRAKPSTRRRKT
jgi:hypothetical protein